MTTQTKARLLFVQTSAQGKTARQPIDIKLVVRAESGFNYTVVEETSSRPPAKMILRRSGDTLIIERDGAVVSEVENFYGEKAVSFTTDGSASLSGSSSYVTPTSTPMGPLPGGDTLVWASEDSKALVAALEAEHSSVIPFFLAGLVAASLGGGESAAAPSGGTTPSNGGGGTGLVTDDGIGGATVTVNYFNAAGVLVDSDVVLSNDDINDATFGTFKVDLAALGYDGTGFITASAVGGRDVNGNALNGAVVYQVLVTDALMGDLAAGDEYQIVLSPLTTVMFQSVVAALGGGLADDQTAIGAMLGGAADLDAAIGSAADEIADIFGLGAYGAEPLTLLTTASDFDPTRLSVERQVNLLLVTLSALGSGMSDGNTVDDSTMDLATGASSAAALSVLNALLAARVVDPEASFSAGDGSLVQVAVENFLASVDDVPAVAAITMANGDLNGLRANGGDGTDSSSARIASAIAGLGRMIAQGGENAELAMTLIAGGDLLPSGQTSLADMLALAFERAVDPARAGFAADLEFDPTELSGGALGEDVFILDGVDGTGDDEDLDVFSADVSSALAAVYAKGDFASVVINQQGAFLDIKRDSVLSSQDADANSDGAVNGLTDANFGGGGNASLAANAVTVIYSDTASSNDAFQADANPLASITKDDRIEVRVQNFDYSSGTYGCGDINTYAEGTIGAAELQYILDKGDVTLAGVSVFSATTVPGSANLTLGAPAEGETLAEGTIRSIFVDAQGDAFDGNSASANALIGVNATVTGSTFAQAAGLSSDANLVLVGDSELSLRTLGALAAGEDSHVGLLVAVTEAGTLTVNDNLLVHAEGYGSIISSAPDALTQTVGSAEIFSADSSFIGGADQNTFKGLVTLKASGAHSSADLTIGTFIGGAISLQDDVLVEASGTSATAHLTIGDVASSTDVATVTFDGGLQVLASGNSSDAILDLVNANVTASNVLVTANGYSADARLNADNGISGTITDITVTASGWSADALADFEGTSNSGETLTVAGDLRVTASGNSSDASLNLHNAVLDNVTVTVDASGGSSEAAVSATNVSGTISTITVEATGGNNDGGEYGAYASADIAGSGDALSVCGDVTVTASGTSSDAQLNISGAALSVGSVDVTASSYDSYASVDLSNVDATVGAFTIEANATGSYAGTYVHGSSELTVESLTITASGMSSEAVAYLGADCGDVTNTHIGGTLTVEASGGSSDASLNAYASGDVTFNGTTLTVTAAGYDSSADAYIGNAYGSLGNVTVQALASEGGASELQGFAFFSSDYLGQAGVAIGVDTVVSVTVDGEDLSYTFTADDVAAYACGDISGLLDALNTQATDFGVGASFTSASPMGPGLFIDYSDYANHSLATLTVTDACGDAYTFGNTYTNAIGISDGSDDAYDDGNFISTTGNSSDAIAYQTEVVMGGDFGVGSERVVVYQDAIFGLMVTGNTENEFHVTGELGADGSGDEDILDLGSYSGFSAIAQRTYGADGETSINRIFIYSTDGSVTASSLDGDTDTEDFTITGLSAVSNYGYFVAYGDGDVALSESELGAWFERLVDNVLTAGSRSAADMRDAFHSNFSNLTDVLPALNPDFEMDGSGDVTKDYLEMNGGAAFADNDAYLQLSGDTMIQGTLTVQALGGGSKASAELNGVTFVPSEMSPMIAPMSFVSVEITPTENLSADPIMVELTGGMYSSATVSVTASGASSEAMLEAHNVSGTINGIAVTASDNFAYAYAVITGTCGDSFTVNGDITVNATALSAEAELYLLNVVLDGSALSVTASGVMGSADLTLDDASGTIASITVLANGDHGADNYAFACADITASFGETLTVEGDVSLTASGVSSEAFLYVTGANFDGGSLAVSATARSSDAFASIDFATGSIENITVTASALDTGASAEIFGRDTLTVSGALSVTASGNMADAELHLQDAVLDNASVVVDASGNSSEAVFNAYDGISGTIHNITVTASGGNNGDENEYGAYASADIAGDLATPEMQGFDVFGLFTGGWNNVDLQAGTTIEVTADSVNFTYTLTCDDVNAAYSDFNFVLNNLTQAATIAGLTNFTLQMDGPGDPGLYIVYNDGEDHEMATVTVTDTCGDSYTFNQGMDAVEFDPTTPGALAVCGDVNVTASGTSSDAALWLANATVAVGSFAVTATGYEGYASADLSNVSGSLGAITVGASGNYADADLYVNESSDVTATVLSVTASGESSDANAYFGYMCGDATSLTLNGNLTATANSYDASVQVYVGSDASVAFNGTHIEILAVANYSTASAEINNASGTINGIVLRASGNSAEASADIYGNGKCGDTLTVSGTVSVTASSNEASADLYLQDAVLNNVTVSVVASGNSSDAVFNAYQGISGTINGITVTASGDNNSGDYGGYASADISGDSGALTVSGALTITASGTSADAQLLLNSATVAVGSMTITGSGTSSDASADLDNVSGTLGTVTIEASGTSGFAGTYVHGSSDVTATSLSVTASGSSSEANAFFGYDCGDTTSLTLNGDLTVTASAYDAEAYAEIGSHDASVTFVGTHIEITANADYSSASAEIFSASGTIEGITLTASGNSSDASADIYGIAGCGDALTVSGSITVTATASATSAEAELYLSRAVLDDVTLSVTAAGDMSSAEVQMTSASGTITSITVLASGEDANGDDYAFACADISEAYGKTLTIQGAMSVTASGQSAESFLYVNDAAFGGGNLTVSATASDSEAVADIDGATGSLGNIIVTASGYSSDASADISGDVSIGALLNVHATGSSSDAEVEIRGHGDSVDASINEITFTNTAIDVRASGGSSDASLDVLDGKGTLASVTVTASAFSSDASGDIDFSGTLAGDIVVTASGWSSEASLVMTAGTRAQMKIHTSESGGDSGIYNYYCGDVVHLAVGADDYSYTVQCGDNFANVVAGLQSAIALDPTSDVSLVRYHGNYGPAMSDIDVIWNQQGAVGTVDASVRSLVTYSVERGGNPANTDYAADYYRGEAGRGSASDRIVLGEDTDVTVSASGYSSEAYLNLDHLSGVVKNLTVSATGGAYIDRRGTDADANVRFDAGYIAHALIETGEYGSTAGESAVASTATLRVAQTELCGDVDVTGDGFATLVIRSEDVKTVDLTGLRTDIDDRWGVFTLDIAKVDRNLESSTFNAANVMSITGFDVSRDAFNNTVPYDDTRNNWGYDFESSRFPYYAEDQTTVFASFAELAGVAAENLDNRGDKSQAGYFFGTYDGDGYVFFDRSAVDSNGLTDVIKLEGVTSFSGINVAQRTYDNFSYATGYAYMGDYIAYEYLNYGRTNNSDYWQGYAQGSGARELEFASARIEGLDVAAIGVSASLTMHGASCGDVYISDALMFRQAEITVSAEVNYGNSADATLVVSNAVGTIDHLYIVADSNGYSSEFNNSITANASVHINSSDVELRELTLKAGDYSCGDANLQGMSGNMQQVTMSVSGDVSYTHAYIGVSSDVLSHIERIDFKGSSDNVGDYSAMSMDVYQGHDAKGSNGGVVYASANGSGDTVISLNYYGGGRAGEIHLGGDAGSQFNFDSSGDLITNGCSDSNRTFNLNLDVTDDNLNIVTDRVQLLDERMQIWGSDMDTDGGDDTIRFTSDSGFDTLVGGFCEDATPVSSLSTFLSNADAALDGSTDYYFGVVDTDGDGVAPASGYLAYDGDGTGVTMLIEFHGMTAFDESRLHLLAPG